MQKIGKTINEIRKNKKITYKEISLKTGIPVSTISDIEKEKTKPSFYNIALICKELNISLDKITNIENNSLTNEEQKLLKQYRLLTEREKGKIEYVLSQILKEKETSSTDNEIVIK